jgi:glycosyltransferase involved in cell wall biosynthesis
MVGMVKSNIKLLKVLFIGANRPVAVILDEIIILKKHFDVKFEIAVFDRKKPMETFRSIKNIFVNSISSDVIYAYFADINGLFAVVMAKMLKKKSVIVVGGFEVACIPELEYGLLLHPGSRMITRYIFKSADKILTVEEGLKNDALANLMASGNNIQTVYTGYDYDKFKPSGEKENLILTVSYGRTWNRARLKGIDTFVKSAQFLPHSRFLIVGIIDEALSKLQKIAPSNVEFIGILPRDDLIAYYQKAKVYCQLSIREGLPNVLCEAMLCECVPVGTNIPGIISAIGDTGFYVPIGDHIVTSEAIKAGLNSDYGKKARFRIMHKFPIARREKELQKIVNDLVAK